MIKATLWILLLLSAMVVAKQAQTTPENESQPTVALPNSRETVNTPETRVAREVLHQLLMLPYYSVFDDLRFSIDPHNNVTLTGEVLDPATKSEAEANVKGVQGVESVKNEIEVLPPSPQDQEIREAEYRSIYGFDGLTKYSWSSVPSIHIIVKSGRVRLVGVVDSDADKNMADIRAKSVPGVFSVENNLRVVPPPSKKK